MKMTDLQCKKFSFSGFKMRILGKVSITAQCIHDGISSGAFHIKANVVQDLAKNLDSECVAGAKMEAQLKAPQSTEVFYPDHGEAENEPIEKVYVTTLVTPMGLASSFNGRISKIMVKK